MEKVSVQAKALSEYRSETLQRFTAEVTEQLEFLNMPNVVLTAKHTTGKLTIHGMDSLEFLISANRGEEPRPLARIASGGELSRIMLALKCVIADRDSIPTLIFDEIDTGVSGKAAQKIGMKLREVGQLRQVLCVTHLSQIAVMADQHLMIEKQTEGTRTETHVMVLEPEGRVHEIARIMGGENPSVLLLETAREELRRWQDDLLPERGRTGNMIQPEALLQQYFGHKAFRAGQKQAIDAILSGRDVLAVMPTGAGKSVCYQISALLLPGVTIVISPLISLMKDQVEALRQVGIPAAYINSSISQEEFYHSMQMLQQGQCRILYVAPERLMTESLLRLAQRVQISMIAVDEAHCVSQWGQDFRQSYLDIPVFMEQLPVRPVCTAFTATATKQVEADIARILKLRDPETIHTGFDRKNLFFGVRRPNSKMTELFHLLKENDGKSGIVYCSTRKAVEEVCASL